jgi:hypothetical protein
MKTMMGLIAALLLAGCASTWVDPRLNVRVSRIAVDCPDDPLGLGPEIGKQFQEAGVETRPFDATSASDLRLKITYRFRTSGGVSKIQSVKAEMVDGRYRSVEARYQWDGDGDTQGVAAQRLVDAILTR